MLSRLVNPTLAATADIGLPLPATPRTWPAGDGHLDSPAEAGFGFRFVACEEHELASQGGRALLPSGAHSGFLYQGQGLGQGGQAFLWPACLSLRLREIAKSS